MQIDVFVLWIRHWIYFLPWDSNNVSKKKKWENARVTLRFLLHNCCCCGFLLPNYMVIIDYSDGIHGATKYMFADLPYIYSWNLYGIRR